MSDAADEADRTIEETLQAALQRRRKVVNPNPGHCLYCDESLPPSRANFCDPYCREGYDREEAARLRNGTPL